MPVVRLLDLEEGYGGVSEFTVCLLNLLRRDY
jgi:hypothetical protein